MQKIWLSKNNREYILMIEDALVDCEEEEKKKEFLEEMDAAFLHIRKLLTWIERSIHSDDISTQVLSGLLTAKIIIFFKEVFEEIGCMKKEDELN